MAKLNAAGNIIVELGDTLSGIAAQFKTTVENLVKKNDIKDPDFIVEDQELVLNGDPVSTVNTTSTCNVNVFGRQTGTERTIYASWTANTYTIKYTTGNGSVKAGGEFTFSFEVVNTHNTLGADNIKVTITSDEAGTFSVAKGSNSFYISTIAAKKSVHKEIPIYQIHSSYNLLYLYHQCFFGL